MLTKENVLKTVSKLPANFSLDDLVDKLIFIDKVQQGLEESMADKIFSKEEANKRLSKWLK